MATDTERTLVIDTATAACSVALFEGEMVLASRHDVVGRGHAERLVPMIAELPDRGRASRILVDVGPGSFTGIRVGIAAAIGLGIGWGAPVAGYSSLALIAIGALRVHTDLEAVAVMIEGGHGELFVQNFAARPFASDGAARSLLPRDALAHADGRAITGNAARWLGDLPLLEALPDASDALRLPPAFRALPPRPLYLRDADAKPRASV